MTPPNKIQALEKHFLDRLSAFVSSVEDSDLTPEKRAERRKRCDADDLEFSREYFPGIFHRPWNAGHRWIAELVSGKYTMDGFRFSGKTAVAYMKLIVKPLALGVQGVVNLNTIKLEIADEHSNALIRIMKSNRKLCYDYKIIFNQEKTGYHIVNGTPFVTGSFRTGLRSIHNDYLKRITYQLNDDLYGVEEAASQTLCEKITSFVDDECWGQLDQDIPSLSLTLGNAINEQSPIVELRKKYPDHHFVLPALANEKGEPDESGESTWPEFRTTKEWHEFARTISWDIWAGQYMCQPAVKGENFYPDLIRYVNVNTIKIIASISACDPSHGLSPEACFKAVTTLGATDKREAIHLDSFIRKSSYDDLFDYVFALMNKMPNWKILLFENDFQQWDFAAPYYSGWSKRTGRVIPMNMHSAKALRSDKNAADKDSRILTLVHPHVTGGYLYDERLKGSPDFERHLQQLYSHGKASAKLDGPDSAATVYIMIWRWIETGSFTPTKEKSWTKDFLRMFRT